MMTLASWVTIKHFMEICCAGGSAAWTGAEGTEEGGWVVAVVTVVGEVDEGPASAL